MTSFYGPTRPSPAEVDAATAATQAAIDDPAASLANVEWAAGAEQTTLAAWRHTPELDHARPERELEIGA